MTPVYQTRGGTTGSCLTACLASILDLPERAVPHFLGGRFDDEPEPEWMGRFVTFHDGWFSVFVAWCWMLGFSLRDAEGLDDLTQPYAIVTGPSSLGPPYAHAVVYERGDDGAYSLAHDPQPGGRGLPSARHFYELIPL